MPGNEILIQKYSHRDLNQQVEAIGGHYMLTNEVQTMFRERQVLYLVGYGLFDTSCCGAGGCAYAIVQGYVISWKQKTTVDSHPISTVERIRETDIQKEIKTTIMNQEMVSQVIFL